MDLGGRFCYLSNVSKPLIENMVGYPIEIQPTTWYKNFSNNQHTKSFGHCSPRKIADKTGVILLWTQTMHYQRKSLKFTIHLHQAQVRYPLIWVPFNNPYSIPPAGGCSWLSLKDYHSSYKNPWIMCQNLQRSNLQNKQKQDHQLAHRSRVIGAHTTSSLWRDIAL